MARDYAKKKGTDNRASRRGAAARGNQPRETGWSWFFSGLFSGLFIAFIAYLALDRPSLAPSAADTEDGVAAEQSEEGREGFDFYQYLPTAEVQVDVVPVDDVGRNAEPEDDNQQYLLQAGSFQDQQDAEGRRANIILLNLDARVVPGMVAGNTWHRVQVGPFSGRQAAEEARQILSSNNIDTIVLKLR